MRCCKIWPVALQALILLMVGCDRAPVTSQAPATAPATAPAFAAPAAAEQLDPPPRVARMLMGDGEVLEFPPAKLALRTRSGQVLALFYSDDPPSAIDANYTGNSFYFETILDISDPSQLPTARWTFKAPSSERADTVNGIFLEGRKQHLQPFDISIEFDSATSPVKVSLSGLFLLFDSSQDPVVPGQIVPVTAEVEADVITKQSNR